MFVDVHLTNRCNLQCRYCYFKEKGEKKSNLELIQKTLEYFLNPESREKTFFTFIGGEPTLEFELIVNAVRLGKKIARKNRRKIFFNLVTNGVNLNGERISFLKENNFYIVLSFDGKKITQDYQRTFPDGSSCFHLVESTLEKLIGQNLTFSVRMTVMPYTAKNLFENVKNFFQKKVSLLGIVPTYEDKWSDDDLDVFKENFRKVIKMWAENFNQFPEFCILPFIRYLKTWKDNDFFFHPYMHYCQVGGVTRYSVSVEGDIYPCHRFTSIRDKKFKLGNILKGGINLNLQKCFNKKVAEVKKEIDISGCFALNYDVNKTIEKPLRNYQRFKDIFLQLIMEIYQNPLYKNFLNRINLFPY
ncbi:MAG: radical SAM protein [Candidatus Omnitrophica bacterium]|nr:radical SAM protein [Candidatus Omnitrophota bacterium]